MHLPAFLFGELGSQEESLVIQSLADDLGIQAIGGGLQSLDVVHCQKGVVVLLKSNVIALQFLLDERVSVQPIGGLKGKEGGYAQHDRSQDLIPDVEIIMGEAAALRSHNAVVRVRT